jgi:hypothetical protein
MALQQPLDKLVGAARDPVRDQGARRARDELEDGPGVVNRLPAEDVAVVIGPHGREQLEHAGLPEQGRHLGLREAEAGAELLVEEGVHSHVIEPGEDALLRHPEDACQHPLVQVRVVLQAGFQEASDEVGGLPVVAMRPRGVDRRVVLVDQDDDARAMNAAQEVAQREERAAIKRFPGVTAEHGAIVRPLPFVHSRVVEQADVLLIQGADRLHHAVLEDLEPRGPGRLEAEVNDRISLEVRAILVPRPIDPQPGEEVPQVLPPASRRRRAASTGSRTSRSAAAAAGAPPSRRADR